MGNLSVVLFVFVYGLVALGTWRLSHIILCTLIDLSNESRLVDALCRRCGVRVSRIIHFILHFADEGRVGLLFGLFVVPIKLFEDQDAVFSKCLREHRVLLFLKAPD